MIRDWFWATKEYIIHYSSCFFLLSLALLWFLCVRLCVFVCVCRVWVRVFSLNCSFSMKICTSNQCTHSSYAFSLRLHLCVCVYKRMFIYSMVVCIRNLASIGPNSIDKMGRIFVFIQTPIDYRVYSSSPNS